MLELELEHLAIAAAVTGTIWSLSRETVSQQPRDVPPSFNTAHRAT